MADRQRHGGAVFAGEVPVMDGGQPFLEIFASMGLQLGSILKRMEADASRRADLMNAIYAVEIPGQIDQVTAGGALVVASPELLGPRSGWFWDVRRVTVSGLASSTETVTIYRGSTGSSSDFTRQNTITTLSGPTGTYGPGLGALLLRAGQSIVIQGTGLTASENVYTSADAIAVRADYIGAYLL
jgi:hypothetical protein